MNELTVITTLRHAETEFNRQRRYAGTLDVPLSEVGIRDTINAAKKMKGMQFDAVVTSTLQRSFQTVQYLLGDHVEPVQTDLCCERNYGGMQGLTEKEVRSMKPKIMYIYEGGDYHSVNPPNGESFEELRRRAEKFDDYLMANYRGRRVLVISHFTFLQQLHGLLNNHDWIASLGEDIKNLQCYEFHLQENRLVHQEVVSLVDRPQCNW